MVEFRVRYRKAFEAVGFVEGKPRKNISIVASLMEISLRVPELEIESISCKEKKRQNIVLVFSYSLN